MIHSVQMPEQDKAWLLEIIEFQKIILGLATERTTAFSNDGREIHAHIERFEQYRANADKITKWIVSKSQLFASLNQYAQHPDVGAKRILRTQIEADIALLSAPQNQRLQVTLLLKTLPKDGWEYGIGNFFYNFYDLWTTPGFQAYLFRTKLALDGNYTRASFVQHFIATNQKLVICPICDASAYRNETSSGTYTSIDHFFPRARYPHLAIHPSNLLPMCPACNSGEAGQTDPQDGLIAITDLLLPYHKEDRGLAGRTYVKIGFRPQDQETSESDKPQPFSHALTFSLQVGADPKAELLVTQIANFEKIYGVQQRWNKENNLTLIDEHVFRRIRQFLLADIERGEPLHDPQFLLERLELLMAMIDHQSLGQDPFSYMMTWWLMYHINRLERQREKIMNLAATSIDCATIQANTEIEPIFKEIYCWAQEQQKVFSELRKRITELRERVSQTIE